jgi:uncharacterized protein (TIGR03435 family)
MVTDNAAPKMAGRRLVSPAICLSLIALLPGSVFGETTPAFEIADVHVSSRQANPFLAAPPAMSGGLLRGDRYDLKNATMLDLMQIAYGVDDSSKIVGGPSWLNTERFVIAAKAPVATPPETIKLMVKALLAERFKLVVHTDTRLMPAHVLSVGKGTLKLKPADDSLDPGCSSIPQKPAPGEVPFNAFSCHKLTMEEFAAWLQKTAFGYISDPVVDQTSLKGAWDFDLKWTALGRLQAAGSSGLSVFDAVDKQLGLRLEPQRASLPVIVVAREPESDWQSARRERPSAARAG